MCTLHIEWHNICGAVVGLLRFSAVPDAKGHLKYAIFQARAASSLVIMTKALTHCGTCNQLGAKAYGNWQLKEDWSELLCCGYLLLRKLLCMWGRTDI